MLPTFCFYCGTIGHSEKACDMKMDDSRKDQVREGQYGSWLRASQVKGGKRGESTIATARNEVGRTMLNQLIVATSEKLVGDKVQREELIQSEGERGRIEGIRLDSEMNRELRPESISDEDSVTTDKIERPHALTEVNISQQHETSKALEKKRFRSKAVRSNSRPNGSGQWGEPEPVSETSFKSN